MEAAMKYIGNKESRKNNFLKDHERLCENKMDKTAKRRKTINIQVVWFLGKGYLSLRTRYSHGKKRSGTVTLAIAKSIPVAGLRANWNGNNIQKAKKIL
jgi:hypothetical protein